MRSPAVKAWSAFTGLVLVALLKVPASAADHATASEWLTWGYDQERTGWNRAETTLSRENVSGLGLQWSTQLSTPPGEKIASTLTAPLVVEGVTTSQGTRTLVFVVGSDDTVFAIDADNGKVVWQRRFPNALTPPQPATWVCPNTQNSTPVIDKRKAIIYLNTSDGKLRGLSLSTGEERLTPTDFVTPFARNWSLNLIDDVIHSSTARGCGGAIANISAMDVSDPARPHLSRLNTSRGRPAGAWGRGGVARGPKGVYAQTADGLYDRAAGIYGETVLALAPKELRIIDSFTPANWRDLNSHDLDLGSTSPIVFPFQGRTLVATIGKEAVLYLLDANALGGPDHSTPLYQSSRLGNDEAMMFSRGVWGSMATSVDAQGQRLLYLPMWGPPSKNAPPFKFRYGDAPRGSVMAFQVSSDGGNVSLIPAWISHDIFAPDPPVVANGVVYAIQPGESTPPDSLDGATWLQLAKERLRKLVTPKIHLVLFAFDAQTGKQLYSSEETIPGWVHFSEPVVAAGKVFVVTWDARVYAFGLKQ
ncbi:MAG TPA: PQQ-binding-like beta-propeller repeat protein [Vicinamibacterales bacterium]|jgi:outer membrane protein assembly factor BamB|nr:PQQ-binding-like beta-propeller repeat protein [Vicinamibacterales bacterium]